MFPGVRLTVELVPKTCWYSNVRSNVTEQEWDRLRKPIYIHAGWVCQICGGRGERHPVECHEIWQYDDAESVQRLTGLIALCPPCHEVKHIGRAGKIGRGLEARKHLATVNGWTPEQVKSYMGNVIPIWKLRSQVQWRLDLDWLSTQGISVDAQSPPGSSTAAQHDAAADKRRLKISVERK